MNCLTFSKKKKQERRFNQFIGEVSKLEVEDFLGLIRILNISAVKEDKEPKDALEILTEVFEKYPTLSNNAQKNLLSILTAANQQTKLNKKKIQKERGETNGAATQDSKE